MKRLLLVLLALVASSAAAVPLDPLSTFCTTNPDQCNSGSQSLLAVRGTGTNTYYVLEVDPTTGELPVSISTGLTVAYSGPTGDPVPAEAAYVGGIDDSGDLQGLHTDSSGDLQVDVLTMPYALNYGAVGATTLRTAAQIGNATGAADFNYGAAGAQTLRTAAQLGNAAGVVDYNYGAGGAQTLRTTAMLGLGTAVVSNTNPVPSIVSDGTNVAGALTNVAGAQVTTATPGRMANVVGLAAGWDGTTHREISVATDGDVNVRVDSAAAVTGRSYADSDYTDFSGTNVTTGAWVEIVAATAATINELLIDQTCGQVLELGTGAAAAETRKLIVPRGGFTAAVNLAIASGTRLSLRAISGNCTTGDFTITGLN